nr:MAG TPA: hypothetical protein [Caudoviricetes sp.]
MIIFKTSSKFHNYYKHSNYMGSSVFIPNG